MRPRNFPEYGTLKWIEPKAYYAGPWGYVESCTTDDVEDGDDSGQYDLVRHGHTMEMRYTVV